MARFYKLCLLLILAGYIEYSTGYARVPDSATNLTSLGQKIIGRRWRFLHWIVVPLDHFNLFDNRTWKMKCYFNAGRVRENSPIFIEVGGEWTVDPMHVGGTIGRLAYKHDGLVIATEHRYYGDSLPFGENCSAENYRYLQIEQALEDVVYVIDKVKKHTSILKNSLVIVHGCSYGGVLARRLRLKYPHLVDIAYASSAPAWHEMEYPGYHKITNDVYANVSQECRDTIKQGFQEMRYFLKTNPSKVRDALRDWPCGNVDDISDDYMATVIKSVVNVQLDPAEYEEVSCIALTMNKDLVGPFERLAKFVLLKTYDQVVRCPKLFEPSKLSTNDLSWRYQVCTELGSFTIYNSSDPHIVYDIDWSAEEQFEACRKLFGDAITKDLLRRSIESEHRRYGKALPGISRIVSTVGVNDPWV